MLKPSEVRPKITDIYPSNSFPPVVNIRFVEFTRMYQNQLRNDFIRNSMALKQVTDIMREKPDPNVQEAQKSKSRKIDKIYFDDKGGILTYMEGHKYPYRGFPFVEFVQDMDKLKKVSRLFMSGIYHNLKGDNKLKLLSLLPALWLFKKLLKSWVYMIWSCVDRFKVKFASYSQPEREIYKTLSKKMKKETAKEKELREQIRDILCMFLEFDNAYRFRFQDLMLDLDKKAFKNKPFKEVDRLLNLLIEREIIREMKDKWVLIKKVGIPLIKTDKFFKNLMIYFFSNINIEEIKLSVEDRYYCAIRDDFNFGSVQIVGHD